MDLREEVGAVFELLQVLVVVFSEIGRFHIIHFILK
jgi:hypothetical protein